MTIKDLTNKTGHILKQNAPAILTGTAIAGAVTTGVLAGRAGYVASREVCETFEHKGADRKEEFKLTWKLYIPPVVAGMITVGCVVSLHRVHAKRAAALGAAYALTSSEFSDYRQKMVEKLGEDKEKDARDEIAKEKVENSTTSQVIMVGEGKQLCYDTVMGRYFESDMESLRRAQNDINDQALHHMFASQNDFFRLIGVEDGGSLGEELGFRDTNLMDISFSSHLASGGKPCLAITYELVPYKYD